MTCMHEEIITEDVDVCPHCDCENHFYNWDTSVNGWIGICAECGKEIMLCDECLHAEDNKEQSCDWCEAFNTKTGKMESMCFRKKQTLEMKVDYWNTHDLSEMVGNVGSRFNSDDEYIQFATGFHTVDEYNEYCRQKENAK